MVKTGRLPDRVQNSKYLSILADIPYQGLFVKALADGLQRQMSLENVK